jgi:hypothetical protein
VTQARDLERCNQMLGIPVAPNSFGLGFIFGTSVYRVLGTAGYMLFCAGRRIAGLFQRQRRVPLATALHCQTA